MQTRGVWEKAGSLTSKLTGKLLDAGPRSRNSGEYRRDARGNVTILRGRLDEVRQLALVVNVF
jgi:hypothetical protein